MGVYILHKVSKMNLYTLHEVSNMGVRTHDKVSTAWVLRLLLRYPSWLCIRYNRSQQWVLDRWTLNTLVPTMGALTSVNNWCQQLESRPGVNYACVPFGILQKISKITNM